MNPESSDPTTPPDTELRLRWSGLTDKGRFRANNEDAFLALAFDAREVRYLGKTGEASLGECDFVFAVSDGMGGERSGEFASKIAVEKITRLLPRAFKLTAENLAAGFGDILVELFHEIHRELTRLGESYEECRNMGATLSLAWFTPGWLYFGHIGDSRIYYLPKEGGMKQITHDHSQLGWMRRQGKINEREQRFHPGKNALNQSLGAGHRHLDPHIGAVGISPGDRFVLVTDGVVDGLWDRAIEEHVREPGESQEKRTPAQRLVLNAVAESGRDNATAVVVEVV